MTPHRDTEADAPMTTTHPERDAGYIGQGYPEEGQPVDPADFSPQISAQIAPLAADADLTRLIIGVAPYAGSVEAPTYYPKADIIGSATNQRRLRLVREGGAGTTVVAELTFSSGVDAAAFAPMPLTPSATAADLLVEPGDFLVFESTHVGTGLADPGGLIRAFVART